MSVGDKTEGTAPDRAVATEPSPASLAGLGPMLGKARRRRPAMLATQMTVAMSVVAALSVIVLAGGMQAFYILSFEIYRSELSPNVVQALDMLEQHRLPDHNDLGELLRVLSEWERQVLVHEVVALAVFAAIALVVGIVTGRRLAGRISDPVHRVAAAARRVAAGDRTVRVPSAAHGAGETHQLIVDFNLMAREMERSERNMRESIAAIAHELRTPLTILRGRLQGMSDGIFPVDGGGIGGLIFQVDSLTRIVEDLRILSLAMAGRLTMTPTVIDLAEEAERALDAFTIELGAAGMAVERQLQPVRLVADGARLRQILLALLDNARRYAASGGVVRVETDHDHEGGYLRVLDRGPGVSARDAERMFQRFWRADESRSRDSGGTGLGLAVVKAIAEAHGGRVIAAPRAGGGICFEVRLPR
ncbi:MAG: ATP-binding protein [Sphingopyxis sp.]|uniref:sensor histidine kinase n=1 Tax=Sphingopyxis sp. TaxID=1908224 RepID=UPI002AB9A1AC|nr:ATP-binding protein [Sphingopyxis sp.]MDZ3833599.1 ATP-binding protein [Sphingopyxis sp.]